MHFMNLSIKTISIFINELALEWSNGTQNYLKLKDLRLACPCAGCSGEKDALGNVYMGGEKPFLEGSFEIIQYEVVGRYGVRFFWKDGHHDGIYTFDLLASLSYE